MGEAAAAELAREVLERLESQEKVRLIFAAAPSQYEFLTALAKEPGIDWSRITAFHMDEYVGLSAGDPRRFGEWLTTHLFDQRPFGEVHLISTDDQSLSNITDYADLLAEAPIDLVILGVGVNGHIAFNDPSVANFADPEMIKMVELDEICRQQQVDDQCFGTLAKVPTHAVTLTVPRLLAADRLLCIVPGAAKAEAVRRTLHDPISEACPATALRTHPDCTLYVDAESAPHD